MDRNDRSAQHLLRYRDKVIPQGSDTDFFRRYYHPNGSISFIDRRYPFNPWCNASIPADADIAGAGTMSAFMAAAALTIAISLVRAAIRTLTDGVFNKPVDSQPAKPSARLIDPQILLRKCNSIITVCDSMLCCLSDMQTVTAAAVIIAAFIQGPTLTFYHEEFIVWYWWITMDSVWAAQTRTPSQRDASGRTIRKLPLILAVTFWFPFQIRNLSEQPAKWDPLDGSKCYLYNIADGYDDSGRNIRAWWDLAGVTLYGVDELLALLSVRTGIIDKAEDTVKESQARMWSGFRRQRQILQLHHQQNQVRLLNALELSSPAVFVGSVSAALYAAAGVILFCLHQYGAFFSFWTGYEPLQVALHAVVFFQSSVALLHLKELNHRLIEGDEYSWKFGQCLPVIMLSATLYTLYLATCDKQDRSIKVD